MEGDEGFKDSVLLVCLARHSCRVSRHHQSIRSRPLQLRSKLADSLTLNPSSRLALRYGGKPACPACPAGFFLLPVLPCKEASRPVSSVAAAQGVTSVQARLSERFRRPDRLWQSEQSATALT